MSNAVESIEPIAIDESPTAIAMREHEEMPDDPQADATRGSEFGAERTEQQRSIDHEQDGERERRS